MIKIYKQIVYVVLVSAFTLGSGQSIQELQKLKAEYEKFQKGKQQQQFPTGLELGVDPQTIVDAVVAIRAEKLDQAVEDGRISQGQADERLAQIETRVTERLDQTLPLGDGHGRRGHRGPGHTEA